MTLEETVNRKSFIAEIHALPQMKGLKSIIFTKLLISSAKMKLNPCKKILSENILIDTGLFIITLLMNRTNITFIQRCREIISEISIYKELAHWIQEKIPMNIE